MNSVIPKKNKIYSYHYFSEPLKEQYTFGNDRKALIEFLINDCLLKLYEDKDGFIEMLRVDIINPDREPEFIAHYMKNYVQSVLRLSYVLDFKFSPVQTKMVGEFNDDTDKPKVATGTLTLTQDKVKPVFNAKMFNGMLRLFSRKPSQIDFFTSNLDYVSDPIGCYSNLYKVIEYEFHLKEDRRDTKEILKKSPFKEIARRFTFEGKTGSELIDYIVDTRHRCDHLKAAKFGTKFGFSKSNIDDVREVQRFMPTMRKICAQVIDARFEILN